MVIFVSIFISLLILASFLDLKISQLIAEPFLVKNQYYTSNFFANTFEILGCLPFSLIITLSLLSLTFYVRNYFKSKITVVLQFVFIFFSCAILSYEIWYEVLTVMALIINNHSDIS
jgi:hypothetical protein